MLRSRSNPRSKINLAIFGRVVQVYILCKTSKFGSFIVAKMHIIKKNCQIKYIGEHYNKMLIWQSAKQVKAYFGSLAAQKSVHYIVDNYHMAYNNLNIIIDFQLTQHNLLLFESIGFTILAMFFIP